MDDVCKQGQSWRVVHAADCPREEDVIAPLWLARFDPDPDNAELADGVWEYCEAQLGPAFVPPLARLLSSPHLDIRRAAASALPAGILVRPPAWRLGVFAWLLVLL